MDPHGTAGFLSALEALMLCYFWLSPPDRSFGLTLTAFKDELVC